MGYESDTINLLEVITHSSDNYREYLELAYSWGEASDSDTKEKLESLFKTHGFEYVGHGSTRLALRHIADNVIVKIETAATSINQYRDNDDFINSNEKEATRWMDLTNAHEVFNYLLTPILDFFYFGSDLVLVYPYVDHRDYYGKSANLSFSFCDMLAEILRMAFYDIDPIIDANECAAFANSVSHNAFIITESNIPLGYDFSVPKHNIYCMRHLLNFISNHDDYKKYISFMKSVFQQ